MHGANFDMPSERNKMQDAMYLHDNTNGMWANLLEAPMQPTVTAKSVIIFTKDAKYGNSIAFRKGDCHPSIHPSIHRYVLSIYCGETDTQYK